MGSPGNLSPDTQCAQIPTAEAMARRRKGCKPMEARIGVTRFKANLRDLFGANCNRNGYMGYGTVWKQVEDRCTSLMAQGYFNRRILATRLLVIASVLC